MPLPYLSMAKPEVAPFSSGCQGRRMQSDSPTISVVLTSWNRCDFLGQSAECIRLQTLDTGRFEVLITTNLSEDQVRANVRGLNFRYLENKRASIGSFYAAAIREARGDVIAFLDDDDLWTPDRLQHVYSAYSTDPELVYYHNLQTQIDWRGNPLPSSEPRIEPSASLGSFSTRQLLLNLNKIGRHRPYFNNSSIAVRRRAVTPWLGYLERMPRSEDSFLFYSTLMSGGKILLDWRRTTQYRTHTQNVSTQIHKPPAEALAAAARFSVAALSAHHILREMVYQSTDHRLKQMIDRDLAVYGILRTVQTGDQNRGKLLRNLATLIQNIRVFDMGFNLQIVSLGIAGLASKALGASVYLAARR